MDAGVDVLAAQDSVVGVDLDTVLGVSDGE
jgi:hypothetical protein